MLFINGPIILTATAIFAYVLGSMRANKEKSNASHRRVMRHTNLVSACFLCSAGLISFHGCVQRTVALANERARVERDSAIIQANQQRVMEPAPTPTPLPTRPPVEPALETLKRDPYRVFRNNKGTEINARLINVDGAYVTVERLDGMKFTTPISLYSETDQEFIRNWQK